jgi:hypothetical protein
MKISVNIHRNTYLKRSGAVFFFIFCEDIYILSLTFSNINSWSGTIITVNYLKYIFNSAQLDNKKIEHNFILKDRENAIAA